MKAGARFRNPAAGFTLIELMVALAILAIVMAIAIPSYSNYVIRTNRTEGKAAIMDAAQALERCYSRFNRYNDAANCTVVTPLGGDGIGSETGTYLVTSVAMTGTTYTLRATPQGTQATRDTECGNFQITHTGQRSISGTGTVEDCW
ncbi:type IV pilin protein [Wenzhouxiangella marina]|uniref:Pilus assembly protein PilE n=1 Tax=Wenzhouxiangella marina TaxID=1579979 RepID=A0A0K0XSN2_9GAMM|nr:type IV pilin protein [Wenzhouxiangella marina]AKS40637.1 pilus assembly protein PilE [Wenzhouxiangella marina]MBB6088405.1 type IV pilus assembly protein PilE [Wenzhouxiangella marina]